MLSTTQAATLYDSLEVELNALLAHYKAAAIDGLTLAEIWELVNNAIASASKLVTEAKAEVGDSATIKDVVLHFAEQLYDEVIAPYDIPKIPNFIETRFVDPALKVVYMHLVEGALASITKIANTPTSQPTAPTDPATPADPAPATPPTDLPDGFVPY